jgi:hypothetical protein
MPPRQKDFGPDDLAEWTEQAAAAVEKRYPFALEPGGLANNPAFHCLLGRGARKGVGLSSGSQKAALLQDNFFVDWLRGTPVPPDEAARGAFGYMLLQRQDAPEASSLGLARTMFVWIVLGLSWLMLGTLAAALMFRGFVQQKPEVPFVQAGAHALLLGTCLLAISWQIPSVARRVGSAAAAYTACSTLKSGKTLGSQAAALPGQLAEGCGCYLVVCVGMGVCQAVGLLAAGALSFLLGLPKWSTIAWAAAAYSLALLGIVWLLANERRRVCLNVLESAFEKIKAEESRG